MGSLEQAVIVVTGASRGIGRAIAEELGFAGAKVVVNYVQSKDAAEDLVTRLQQSGTESIAIQADVSDPQQAARLIEETVQRFSRIDVLVNNAGIIGFTRTAALELAHSNITVNAVCPGYIATEMYESIPEKTKEAIIARIPLGRPGRPEEVARGVRYLIVDGDYITGTTLDINGGAFMH